MASDASNGRDPNLPRRSFFGLDAGLIRTRKSLRPVSPFGRPSMKTRSSRSPSRLGNENRDRAALRHPASVAEAYKVSEGQRCRGALGMAFRWVGDDGIRKAANPSTPSARRDAS